MLVNHAVEVDPVGIAQQRGVLAGQQFGAHHALLRGVEHVDRGAEPQDDEAVVSPAHRVRAEVAGQVGDRRLDPLPSAELQRVHVAGAEAWQRAGQLIGRIEKATKAADPLTEREREVADLLAQAMSNRDIADRLVLSERTVESHVRNILTKLGFTSRTQVAAWALKSRGQ